MSINEDDLRLDVRQLNATQRQELIKKSQSVLETESDAGARTSAEIMLALITAVTKEEEARAATDVAGAALAAELARSGGSFDLSHLRLVPAANLTGYIRLFQYVLRHFPPPHDLAEKHLAVYSAITNEQNARAATEAARAAALSQATVEEAARKAREATALAEAKAATELVTRERVVIEEQKQLIEKLQKTIMEQQNTQQALQEQLEHKIQDLVGIIRTFDDPLNVLLLEHASAGDIEAVKAALKLGANINAQDENMQNALHKACYANQLAMVKFLLGKGIDFTKKDSARKTPSEMTTVVEIKNLIEEHQQKSNKESEAYSPTFFAVNNFSSIAKNDFITANDNVNLNTLPH